MFYISIQGGGGGCVGPSQLSLLAAGPDVYFCIFIFLCFVYFDISVIISLATAARRRRGGGAAAAAAWAMAGVIFSTIN